MNTPFPEDRLGDYQLHREVGRGAMGIVYEATHQASGRRVALKLLVFPLLLPEAEREALVARFAREARALAAVRHANVVEVLEVGEVGGQPFMAMEYLEGLNARERLLHHGPLPPEQVTTLGAQLCDALEAVHAAGIVHRDIKPENLVLEPDGRLKLTDFGIARVEVEASITRTGGLLGSPAYMAPEQILGGAVDARSDLFSTGVALYQMLTGELPFQGSSIVEMAHRVAYDPPRAPTGVPPRLAAVILRALEKVPARRFGTAAALRKALERAADTTAPAPDLSPAMTMGGPTPADLFLAGASRPSPAAAASPGAVCTRHPHRLSTATCTECGEPLCGGCVRHRLGLSWCPEHASPPARPLWVTRLEVVGIGVLFALLLWSLYPLRW